MDQKGHKMGQKGLIYMKKGFLDQKYLFFAQFLLWNFGSESLIFWLFIHAFLALVWSIIWPFWSIFNLI